MEPEAYNLMDLNITMAEGEHVEAFKVFCKKCKGDIYIMLLNGENAGMFAQAIFEILATDYLECSKCGEKGKLLMRGIEL